MATSTSSVTFAEISRIAREMQMAIKSAKWADVERLLNEEWNLRRTNAPGISTPLIDKLIAAARKHGARAAEGLRCRRRRLRHRPH